MHRLVLGDTTYLCLKEPISREGSIESALAGAIAGHERAPDVVYWNLEVEGEAGGLAEICMGAGGLDPLLVEHQDLSRCIAVEAQNLQRLDGAGAEDGRELLGVLQRLRTTPHFRSVYCPGLKQRVRLDALAAEPSAAGAARADSVETISVAILSCETDDNLTALFEALYSQGLDARLEVLTLLANGVSAEGRQRAKQVDAWSAAHPLLKLRRFAFSGDVAFGYMANVAMALATGEVVVIAHAQCAPGSPSLLENLARWCAGAEVATVSPRIEHGGRLLAAGLSLTAGGEAPSTLVPFDDDVFSDGARLCAAPTPWMFASRRRAWLAAGGFRPREGPLWTAPMAGDKGPPGRHVLLGSEVAVWTGEDLPPTGPTAAPRKLRPSAIFALRRTKRSASFSGLRAPGAARLLVRREATKRPAHEAVPRLCDDPDGRSFAPLRLLVFADGFGASQSIAFIQGLAGARRRAEAAVTIVTETDFAQGDGEDVARQVQALFTRQRPTVAIVSRLGDGLLWEAVHDCARSAGVPLVLHIDDDLFDAPVTLGIERFRHARSPSRQQALHAALRSCDLIMAATLALAVKLGRIADHRRIAVMALGSAASVPLRVPRRTEEVVIGYMGAASHNHDLAMIAPALNRVLRARQSVRLILFGSIGSQPVRQELHGRISVEPGVFGDYPAFKRKLAELGMDIGLAPLRNTAFNRCKTNTKWLEYAEAGAAVLASDVEPYFGSSRAGALLSASDDGWEFALLNLVDDAALRARLVAHSDGLIRRAFTWDQLEAGMLHLLRGLVASSPEMA